MLIPPDLDAATRALPATDVVSCLVLIDQTTRDVQSLYVSHDPFSLYRRRSMIKSVLFFFSAVLLLALMSTKTILMIR